MNDDPEWVLKYGDEYAESIVFADGSILPGNAHSNHNGWELYVHLDTKMSVLEGVMLFSNPEKTRKISYKLATVMSERPPESWEGYTVLDSVRKDERGLQVILTKANV